MQFLLDFAFGLPYLWFARYHTKGKYLLSYIINLLINVILPVIIVISYMYIICFAYRHSNALSQSKVNGNKDLKRLTLTIMFIFISQTNCVIPYQLTSIAVHKGNFLPGLLDYWFFMLRNNTYFFNGISCYSVKEEKQGKKLR